MQQFNLIENALHSLRESIYYYSEADKTENADLYKFSILLSAQCAELLMKEILVRNHPALVLSDIDRSNRSENPETVGYRQAIHRVISLCGIDLSFYKEELANYENQNINASVRFKSFIHFTKSYALDHKTTYLAIQY